MLIATALDDIPARLQLGETPLRAAAVPTYKQSGVSDVDHDRP
jgi:hypothetical protein